MTVPVPNLKIQIPNLKSRPRWAGWFFALLCSALVLALGVVSVSDQLHAQLHHVPDECGHAHSPAPDDAEHDLTCAVELFAAGVSVPVDPTHLIVAPLAAISRTPVAAQEFLVGAPDHRQPPGRGPPAA